MFNKMIIELIGHISQQVRRKPGTNHYRINNGTVTQQPKNKPQEKTQSSNLIELECLKRLGETGRKEGVPSLWDLFQEDFRLLLLPKFL